jgi:hypothetical protein
LPLYVERDTLPLLRLRYVGDFSDAELSGFFHELEAILALPTRKVCLFDLRAATPGSAEQRQLQGAWIKRHQQALAKGFAAAAIVTDSALIRGAITAVFWISPLPFPSHVAPSLRAAEEWLAPYLKSLSR